MTSSPVVHVIDDDDSARDALTFFKNIRAVRGEIEASIERNPMTAVLAFGIGMLIGRMNRFAG